jgi:hypothetical protein
LSLPSLLAVAVAGAAHWSTPATLSPCPSLGGPSVVFPQDSPQHPTGPGGIVWGASASCPDGEGARVDPLGPGDVPGPATVPHTASGQPIGPQGAITASGGPRGQIVMAGSHPGTPARGLLVQGGATGPFSTLSTLESPPAPIALTTGYLGDVALAYPSSPAGAPNGAGAHDGAGASTDAAGPSVGVERFFARRLISRAAGPTRVTKPVGAVTVALDYRSDALAVWVQGGAVYAHDLPASGAPHPIQLLARVGPGERVRLAALLSDDNRGMVAFVEDGYGHTSVYLDRSHTGVRFGATTLLERFSDPDGLPSPAGSPSLVRLSSESVMIAWAGSTAGRWVVRTAAVDLDGVGNIDTIPATNGGDALLADLQPGPHGEAMVLWSEPQQPPVGPPEMDHDALYTARGMDVRPDATLFGAPEQLAPPGPNSDPTLALDPGDDVGVAAWRGAGGELLYAVRASPTGAP